VQPGFVLDTTSTFLGQMLTLAVERSMSGTTLVEPISALIDAKLGRCTRCMRLSAHLTIGSWLLLAAMIVLGVSSIVAIAALIAVLCTTVSVAHGVAYYVREPGPVQGCNACAQKSKERARRSRRQRVWQRVRHPFAALAAEKKAARRCNTCKPRITAANIHELADHLPSADEDLRAVVEASPEYQLVVSRLAAPDPVDTWQADMRNHFIYRLQPDVNGHCAHALFIARWEDDELLSAVLIRPGHDGEPTTVDLRATPTDPSVVLPTS
jgi:hypothetical protein